MRFITGLNRERIGYDFFCDVAERMVEARKVKGWSQGDLARKTKLSVSKISEMENVKVRFALKDLETLAKALDVTVDWLIDAHLDAHGKECRYLVWSEKCPRFQIYFDASSARMAYLKAHAHSREQGYIWFESRDRAMVQLVGVPVEKADLEAHFRKRKDDADDQIEPDSGGSEA